MIWDGRSKTIGKLKASPIKQPFHKEMTLVRLIQVKAWGWTQEGYRRTGKRSSEDKRPPRPYMGWECTLYILPRQQRNMSFNSKNPSRQSCVDVSSTESSNLTLLVAATSTPLLSIVIVYYAHILQICLVSIWPRMDRGCCFQFHDKDLFKPFFVSLTSEFRCSSVAVRETWHIGSQT